MLAFASCAWPLFVTFVVILFADLASCGLSQFQGLGSVALFLTLLRCFETFRGVLGRCVDVLRCFADFGSVASALWGLSWLGSVVASELHSPLVALWNSLCFRDVLGRCGFFRRFAGLWCCGFGAVGSFVAW